MAERNRTEDVPREELPSEAPASVATPPLTESEQRKKRQEALLVESEENRAQRCNDEQARLVAGHDENIKTAAAMYPVPDGVPFEELTVAQQGAWNQRRTSIDQANRAYHLAAKRLIAAHEDEDNFLAQQRVAAKS